MALSDSLCIHMQMFRPLAHYRGLTPWCAFKNTSSADLQTASLLKRPCDSSCGCKQVSLAFLIYVLLGLHSLGGHVSATEAQLLL